MIFSILFCLSSLLFQIQYGLSNGYGKGFKPSDYGKRFFGEGTYYGYTEGGNCAMGPKAQLPAMYQKMLAVAINDDQYDYSRSCGACIELRGPGRGSGGSPIRGIARAYIHDRCPECRRGDVDLSKGGDGRWAVNWKFVPCPNNDASFVFEGSNNFYKKIQVRGLRYPAAMMFIAGRKAERSQDNFFIAHGGFPHRGTIRVIDIKGNQFRAFVNLNRERGIFRAPRNFNGGGKRTPKKSSPPRRRPPPPRKCVPNWMGCSSALNKGNKPCCSKGYKCRSVPWSVFKHCYKA